MSQSANPPGIVLSVCLVLLGAGAIWAGIDAIVSDSVTTPSKYGSGARVHGSDTVLVGSGWLLIGLGVMNRVIAGHAAPAIERWITLGCCILGGLLWLLVFV